MTRSGQSNYSGVNAQAWAAMSMFLQFTGRGDFRYIGFEGEKLEDFHLVFSDGRKMICESKSYNLNYSDIRNILDKIHNHNMVNEGDEIVLICKTVNKNAKTEIERYQYNKGRFGTKLTSPRHGYKDYHLNLLSKVKFWEVSKDINQKLVEALIARHLGVWVPEEALKDITANIVLEEVYHGSAKGDKLNRTTFLKKLQEKKAQILNYSGYEVDRLTAEKDVEDLIGILKSNKDTTQIIASKISDISRNPSEFNFLITRLKERTDLDLGYWKQLWEASVRSFLVLHVFDIFGNNLATKENQKYALQFSSKVLEGSYEYFREDFIKKDISELCKKVFDKSHAFENEIFQIIKKLLSPTISDFLFSEKSFNANDKSWERDEISKVIEHIYNKTNTESLKDQIISYLGDTFNLVGDYGRHWFYTPPSVFSIFCSYAKERPKKRILILKKIYTRQYNNHYNEYGSTFKFLGWEGSGSGISQMGSDFSISDNNFVSLIIQPALLTLYAKDKQKAWEFIVEHCVTTDIGQVSDDRPDFLNRAAIPILISEYKNGNHSIEAFHILKSFIEMGKGIPWKPDLIYQAVRNDNALSNVKRWKLVKVSLEKYKNLPVNVFVQQIISDLASKSNNEEIQLEATRVIKSWSKDPDYAKRSITDSYDIVDNISKLLDNPKKVDDAIEVFSNYISSPDFIENDDSWRIWDEARTLAKILEKDFVKGIDILKSVSSCEKLSQNQQNLVSASLTDISNGELLKQIYDEFVFPEFNSLGNNIQKIELKYPHRYAREQFVRFAEKLAEEKYLTEALSMVKIFIDDSDPIVENYSDDKEGAFNEHDKIKKGEDSMTIHTVRGYCAWAIQKMIVPRDFTKVEDTRRAIEESIFLLKKLSTDKNFYIRVQATIPLIELAKNRNTVLPENRSERFLSIKTAEEIKNLAFIMLRDNTNHKLPTVMKHLAMVFSHMRSLSQDEAYEVLGIFTKDEYPDKDRGKRGHESFLADVLDEASPLFIFFAEFRNYSFKDWPIDWPPLGNFNEEPFRNLLVKMVLHEDFAVRRVFAWQFARIPLEIKNINIDKRTITFSDAIVLSAKYLEKMTGEYNHEVFENIYRFVSDYISDAFDVCFNLWSKCIDTESKFFKENLTKENWIELHWWPYFYNGKILVEIAQRKGDRVFLDYFRKLVEYPLEVDIANDLDDAVNVLIDTKTNHTEVEQIFARLISRNPKYYDDKKKWELKKS